MMFAEKRVGRSGAEFSRRVRDDAVNSWYKKNPFRNERLVVHHRCPVVLGKRQGVPSWLLKSSINAEAMPQREHEELHRLTTTQEFITICQALLGLAQQLKNEIE